MARDTDATPADRVGMVAPRLTAPPAVRTADGSGCVSVGDGDREAAETISGGFVSGLVPPGPGAFGPDRREYERLTGVERAAYERGRAAERAELAAVAPGEIGIEDAGCVQVVMPPAALAAYRHWLTGRDLHLYRIPGLGDGDLPTYAIGIGAERPGAAGGVS